MGPALPAETTAVLDIYSGEHSISTRPPGPAEGPPPAAAAILRLVQDASLRRRLASAVAGRSAGPGSGRGSWRRWRRSTARWSRTALSLSVPPP